MAYKINPTGYIINVDWNTNENMNNVCRPGWRR